MAISYLSKARLSSDLPRDLHLMVPALHVALREHAAAGVYGQSASRSEHAGGHEGAPFTFAAEPEPFKSEQDVAGKAIVDME